MQENKIIVADKLDVKGLNAEFIEDIKSVVLNFNQLLEKHNVIDPSKYMTVLFYENKLTFIFTPDVLSWMLKDIIFDGKIPYEQGFCEKLYNASITQFSIDGDKSNVAAE